jgi:hypothetical protein
MLEAYEFFFDIDYIPPHVMMLLTWLDAKNLWAPLFQTPARAPQVVVDSELQRALQASARQKQVERDRTLAIALAVAEVEEAPALPRRGLGANAGSASISSPSGHGGRDPGVNPGQAAAATTARAPQVGVDSVLQASAHESNEALHAWLMDISGLGRLRGLNARQKQEAFDRTLAWFAASGLGQMPQVSSGPTAIHGAQAQPTPTAPVPMPVPTSSWWPASWRFPGRGAPRPTP